ncbi:hypothetical protein TNCV_1067931 [Trichonephila clavipes]|nr:hypothetical protein TNCV_1067931 [Trichonephila clavipes]
MLIEEWALLPQEMLHQLVLNMRRRTSTGSIEESLVGSLAVTEKTGEYLTNEILGELEKNGLDIQNCR